MAFGEQWGPSDKVIPFPDLDHRLCTFIPSCMFSIFTVIGKNERFKKIKRIRFHFGGTVGSDRNNRYTDRFAPARRSSGS